LVERPSAVTAMKLPILALLAASIAWAVLCLVLALGGHAPSVVLIPIPRESYYLAQAAYVVPLSFVLWGICSLVAQWVATKLGGSGSLVQTARGMAFALAAAIGLALVIPDLIIYGAFGFSALARAVRITAPLMALTATLIAARAVRDGHALSWPRALASGASGVLAQGLVGGIFLR
jgi:hypothetical protein